MRYLAKTAMAAAAALTMISGGVANAAILMATYTGTIRDGYDTTGEFGVVNRYLTSLPFVATYRYDTDLGTRSYVPGFADQLFEYCILGRACGRFRSDSTH